MCKIITVSDLQNQSDEDLRILYRIVSEKLAQSEPGSDTRRTMRASLENIQYAITARRVRKPKPPGC